MSAPPARLAVILVNWNRWQDTLECLESLLRSTVPLKVIVVDNASSDGSPEHIEAWAAGHTPATPASAAMAALSTPPLPKPIAITRLSAAEPAAQPLQPLTLIDSGGNLGFAGGNNVGIRLALSDPAIAHVWLLNNDTVVAAETAERLLKTLDTTPNIGQCGTTVRYYHDPQSVQALCGSRFQPLTGRSWGLGLGSPAGAPVDAAAIAAKTDFVLGASLAVSREFVSRVGLMEERYFLYFEEIDWAVRNRRLKGGPLATAFAADALVWHKEGGSIGSSNQKNARSKLSDYWLTRSRLAFIARHYPLLIPVHLLLTLGYIARHILQGRPGAAVNLTRALFQKPFCA